MTLVCMSCSPSFGPQLLSVLACVDQGRIENPESIFGVDGWNLSAVEFSNI